MTLSVHPSVIGRLDYLYGLLPYTPELNPGFNGDRLVWAFPEL